MLVGVFVDGEMVANAFLRRDVGDGWQGRGR